MYLYIYIYINIYISRLLPKSLYKAVPLGEPGAILVGRPRGILLLCPCVAL